MPKFRKKPIVIEAIQFVDGGNLREIEDFIRSGGGRSYWNNDGFIVIETLEGDMRADRGDWIIKGVSGEFYPCKDDIFKKTYDQVDERSIF